MHRGVLTWLFHDAAEVVEEVVYVSSQRLQSLCCPTGKGTVEVVVPSSQYAGIETPDLEPSGRSDCIRDRAGFACLRLVRRRHDESFRRKRVLNGSVAWSRAHRSFLAGQTREHRRRRAGEVGDANVEGSGRTGTGRGLWRPDEI